MDTNQIQADYDSLRKECLENKVFKAILEDVEQDIISGIKKSPEDAVLAYHEYSALQRIIGKIQALKHNAETQRTIMSQTMGNSDY